MPRDSHSPNLGAAISKTAQLDQSASPEVPGRVPTVLIIQSDPIIRNLLRDLLSRNGYTVLDAVNVSEATELLRQLADEHIDLVIVAHDAGLAAGLLDAHRGPGIKVLLTCHADAMTLPLDTTVMPDTAFLQHPFTEARLLAAVSRLLNPITQ